jgi:hypothetical protein
VGGQYRPLSEAQCGQIYHTALRILEELVTEFRSGRVSRRRSAVRCGGDLVEERLVVAVQVVVHVSIHSVPGADWKASGHLRAAIRSDRKIRAGYDA